MLSDGADLQRVPLARGLEVRRARRRERRHRAAFLRDRARAHARGAVVEDRDLVAGIGVGDARRRREAQQHATVVADRGDAVVHRQLEVLELARGVPEHAGVRGRGARRGGERVQVVARERPGADRAPPGERLAVPELGGAAGPEPPLDVGGATRRARVHAGRDRVGGGDGRGVAEARPALPVERDDLLGHRHAAAPDLERDVLPGGVGAHRRALTRHGRRRLDRDRPGGGRVGRDGLGRGAEHRVAVAHGQRHGVAAGSRVGVRRGGAHARRPVAERPRVGRARGRVVLRAGHADGQRRAGRGRDPRRGAGDLQPRGDAVLDRQHLELGPGLRVHELRGPVALAAAERGDVDVTACSRRPSSRAWRRAP